MSKNINADRHTDILVISAHPDDAELAIGGLISNMTSLGKKVTIINFTVSETDKIARDKRIAAATQAATILGAQLDWANDQKFDQIGDIPEYACVKEVDRLVSFYTPKIVMTHTDVDSHADHIRLAHAVLASARRWDADLYAFQPNEYKSPIYQTFQPNFFMDTSSHVEKKYAAIDCYNYNSENFRRLDINAIKKLDAARGTMNGYDYAEGLKIIRKRGINFI